MPACKAIRTPVYFRDNGIRGSEREEAHPFIRAREDRSLPIRKEAHLGAVHRSFYGRWSVGREDNAVPNSVLDAIKLGEWDFEPEAVDERLFDSTAAMPGTREKLTILAQRVEEGLPLWHSRDRRHYDEDVDEVGAMG